MKTLLFIFGTRPEVIKLAPVIQAAQASVHFNVKTCVTGQHREMLDQALILFGINPDYDLGLMQPDQSLSNLTANALKAIDQVIRQVKPDWIIVQGDTTTTFVGALTGFYHQIPVAHVEAGLRSGDKSAPWPEEMNRILTTHLSHWHFAPTADNARLLRKEGVADSQIDIVGNTGIDALMSISKRFEAVSLAEHYRDKFKFLSRARRWLLVTGHRRESFGEGFQNICYALKQLARRNDIEIVYPVHLNPQVREPVHQLLRSEANIHLLPPQDYLSFIYLMRSCFLILSDSGGIQEEAPALGKPVLVMREVTERQEAVEAGAAKLVGVTAKSIVKEVNHLLDDDLIYDAMSQAKNVFGDGKAAQRILNRLLVSNEH